MIHDLIRANNAAWAAMYYDELVDTPDYQLTFMAEADAGYYSCAQAVSRCSPEILSTIEAFYVERALRPAVYLDPESDPALRSLLLAAGYAEVPEEEENCHLFDLTGSQALPRSETALRIPAERVRLVHLTGPDDPLFDAFIDVDCAANALPDAVRAKLVQHLRAKARPDVEVHCFLALVDGVPTSSRVMALCREFVLCAEAGTLEPFRRLGLYSSLMLEGLAFARSRGARFAFQTAAASAHSNEAALKLGFRRVCTRTYMQRTWGFGIRESDLTDAVVETFYADNGGSRMFEPETLTPPVKAYLRVEARPLCDEQPLDHLIEIGCGHGRHLRWAVERGLHYDGIDMVASLIEKGLATLREVDPRSTRCKLHVGSVENLHTLWGAEGLDARRASTIVFFPFNCFGNLARPDRVASAIAATGARAFLSVFSPSLEAIGRRLEYYKRNQYTAITAWVRERGVLFTSAEGLRSWAYQPRYLEEIFAAVGYTLTRAVAMGPIAAGYLFSPAPSGLPLGAGADRSRDPR